MSDVDRPGATWEGDDGWDDWEDTEPEAEAPVGASPAPKGRRARKRAEEQAALLAAQHAAQQRMRQAPVAYRGGRPVAQPVYLDAYEDELPAPAGRGRGCLVGLVVLAMIVACVGAGVTWVRRQIDPPGAPGAAVALAIPKGTSGAELGRLLHANGIIGSDTLWRVWSQSKGVKSFQAGRYNFQSNSSFDEAVATLDKGPAIPQQQNITIPEGFRLTQVAQRVGTLPERSAEKFTEAVNSGGIRARLQPAGVTNLEGMLFPDTYAVDLDDDELAIVTRMVERFDEVASEVGLEDAQEKVGLSPYEAVIVASLIEREAKFDDERGKVARVIYNRIEAKMSLQIDATLIYANGGNRVLFDDLKVDGPYNTYTRKGLPPTPIAMPGKASLEAALNPTEGKWKYYVVAEADGRSAFAETFTQHKRNIALAKERGLR